jgi:multiple sugar transport system permease protein
MTLQVANISARRSGQKRVSLGKVLTYSVLGFWAFVCLFPLYWVAITTLKGEHEIVDGPFYFPFVDFTPSLDAWSYILDYVNDHLLWRFFNSAAIGLTSTVLTVLLGGMAVYGLTRFRCSLRLTRRGPVLRNDGILFAILATRILPPIVVALPVYFMAQYTGTLDTRFALIFTYTASNLPVAVWLLLAVFGKAATHQEEAAQLDGASRFGIFFTIFLPMVATSIAAVSTVVFILCWNEYIFAAYLASNGAMTLPPWVIGQMSIKEAQVGGEAEEWAHLSAATVFMVLPILACTAFAQRFLGRMALWSR